MNGAASANGRPKPTDKAKGTGAKGAEKKDPAVLKREKQLAEEAEVCCHKGRAFWLTAHSILYTVDLVPALTFLLVLGAGARGSGYSAAEAGARS